MARLRSRIVSRGQIIATNLFAAPGSTMARPSGVQTEMYASNVLHRQAENGNNVLENLRIFKVGTFTDMFGFEHTWDDVHLEQMVQHYKLLRDGGYLPNVPLRAGHTMSVRDVVGYFEDVYRDPDDDQFLSATVEFTEPDAWEKWERGTWRSRSIEIGMYETNDGRSFWPVVMGLAFVDIPAVEGLHARQKSQFNFSTYVTDNEENNLFPDINTNPQAWADAVNADPEGFNKAAAYAAWVDAANYAQACLNWERAVNYAHALEQEAQQNSGQASITGNQPSTSEEQTTGGGQPPVNHAAPPQVMNFRVNGQSTSDFAAIQSHIDTLEAYRAEAQTAGRRSFVEDLARENKIAASQIDALANHALTLNDEQFATFRQMYENAPAMPGVGQHFGLENTGEQQQHQSNTGEVKPDEIETAKEIVSQHRRAGMSEDKIQATASYKKLTAAGITF